MSDQLQALTALSPLDGRYQAQLIDVAEHFSEFALIKQRVRVEVAYLLFLANKKIIPSLNNTQQKQLQSLVEEFSETDALAVKKYEKQTRHDVKAVEYFLRERLGELKIPHQQFVHIALTSEDTNSLAFGLMLKEFKQTVLLPLLRSLLKVLTELAETHAETIMLARTHGQPAIPTTFGKEMMVFAHRIYGELKQLESLQIEAKMSGAVGTFAAQQVAFPKADWVKLSGEFISSLGLQPVIFSTQIVPAESYAHLCSSTIHINTICIDLAQDIWRYISNGYLIQKKEQGQVGSSTMPHKINPIDFENSEGNLGIANSLLSFFIHKLPISRLQRDLSDSTVKRSMGTAFGHACLGYRSLMKGLTAIGVDSHKMSDELDNHWEIISEAYQVILRINGDEQGYEKLMKLSQGKKITQQDLEKFVATLKVSPAIKKQLLAITPHTYVGLASQLTTQGAATINKYLQGAQ